MDTDWRWAFMECRSIPKSTVRLTSSNLLYVTCPRDMNYMHGMCGSGAKLPVRRGDASVRDTGALEPYNETYIDAARANFRRIDTLAFFMSAVGAVGAV